MTVVIGGPDPQDDPSGSGAVVAMATIAGCGVTVAAFVLTIPFLSFFRSVVAAAVAGLIVMLAVIAIGFVFDLVLNPVRRSR